MDKLNQLAEAAKPDYLFAAYSGKFAAAFLQDIPQLRRPLQAWYLPSMMALPQALAGCGMISRREMAFLFPDADLQYFFW